ncbi:MAG: hypothetical protein Homavirus12_1, partial [Homavirus sp.]
TETDLDRINLEDFSSTSDDDDLFGYNQYNDNYKINLEDFSNLFNDNQYNDNQYNDNQYNDNQYNDNQYNDTQSNDSQYNGTQCYYVPNGYALSKHYNTKSNLYEVKEEYKLSKTSDDDDITMIYTIEI